MSALNPHGTSVLQDWVPGLTLAMQGTLLTCVRGPDNVRKDHPVKKFVRRYRRAFLNNAKAPPSGFMDVEAFMTAREVAILRGAAYHPRDEQDALTKELVHFWESQVDDVPHHWLMHFAHCAEILGYRHPEQATALFWREVYYAICASFHMAPESCEQMELRLRDRGCF